MLFRFLVLVFAFLSLPSHAAEFWPLRGKILPGTAVERGHYEVGLYSVLGADGLPASYPLVQAILPAGHAAFRLRVPARVSRAYLFAEFVEEGTGHRRWIVPTANPFTPGTRQPAELFLRVDPSSRLPAAAAANEITVRGSVGTLFADKLIPQDAVEVRVRGRRESVRTDAHGNFALTLPVFRGRVALEFLKDGFHPVIAYVGARDSSALHVDLASRDAMSQIAQRLGVKENRSLGVVLGTARTEKGEALPGLTAQLSVSSQGPFYFDDGGVPSRDLRSTSHDGRFLFLNVKPGAAFLGAEIGGETVMPIRVSTVEGGELVRKDITPVNGILSGRIFHAVKKGGPAPLVGARVRIEGAFDWTTSDSLGAFRLGPFKWSRGERVSLVFSAANFQNHRYQLSPGTEEHRLYAFPALYLERLAQSHDVGLDPAAGMVVANAPGARLRVDALSDQPGVNPAQDFYFDERGRMRPAPAMTDPRFGTFLIFNLPTGHAYLLGHDADGKLRYSKDIYAGERVVNVEVENDR